MKNIKKQKGITLIALIITIAILVIVAVISISTINKDGIIGHAENLASKENSMHNRYDDLVNQLKNDFAPGNDGGTNTCAHAYLNTVINPTCISKGYTIHTCSICGDTYKDNIKPLIDHDYDYANGKITSDGKIRYTCKVCGHILEVEQHSHSYTYKTIEPTCTAEGYTLGTCKCGFSYKTNIKPALGHDWGAWGLKGVNQKRSFFTQRLRT